jgi:hypothetical protein
VSKLIYHIDKNQFCHDNGLNVKYVRKSLDEWLEDLSIWFANGRTRRMSKFTLCKVFKTLVNDGLLHKFKDGQNISGYGVNEKVLVYRIKQHNPELRFTQFSGKEYNR